MKRYFIAPVVFQVVLLWGFDSLVLARTDISVPDANDMISSNELLTEDQKGNYR